mgnify:CR=1 FL=1
MLHNNNSNSNSNMLTYIRDAFVIGIYSFIIISQLISTSYIIDNIDNINNILDNNTFMLHCNNDGINKLNDGSLLKNTMALLITSSLLIGSFIMIMINKILNKRRINKNLNNLDNINKTEETGLINNNIININMYEHSINTIFIISIISFIITSIIQYLLQSINVDDSCIDLINNNIKYFYVFYKLMQTVSFFVLLSLFIITPLYIY